MRAPWAAREKQLAKAERSLPKQTFHGLIRFYQRFISPIKGFHCPLYPSCSAYSILANRKHGPMLGLMMTADRLIHETGEQKFLARIKTDCGSHLYDPVSNNDFWFDKDEKEAK